MPTSDFKPLLFDFCIHPSRLEPAIHLFHIIKTHIHEIINGLALSMPTLFEGVPINLQKEEFERICQKQGKMFGILVAKDQTGQIHIYRAFSGQIFGLWQIKSWVPPCHAVGAYRMDFMLTQMTLHQIESAIQSISIQIDKQVDHQAIRFKQQRKILSQKMTQIIQQHYSFFTQNGTKINLLEVWPNPPTGTGDCCSIKLLNACFQNRHQVIALSEFWIGKQKQNLISQGIEDQNFQEHIPCAQRCLPLFKWLFNLS